MRLFFEPVQCDVTWEFGLVSYMPQCFLERRCAVAQQSGGGIGLAKTTLFMIVFIAASSG